MPTAQMEATVLRTHLANRRTLMAPAVLVVGGGVAMFLHEKAYIDTM